MRTRFPYQILAGALVALPLIHLALLRYTS